MKKMRKIDLILACFLTGLMSLAHAVTLPGPIVTSDWLARNAADVQIIEVRTDTASYTKNPVFNVDKQTGRKVLAEVGGHIDNSTLLDFKKVRVEYYTGDYEKYRASLKSAGN